MCECMFLSVNNVCVCVCVRVCVCVCVAYERIFVLSESSRGRLSTLRGDEKTLAVASMARIWREGGPYIQERERQKKIER